jgi:hypothetical protein
VPAAAAASPGLAANCNVQAHSAQAALERELVRMQRLHAERAADPILSAALEWLGTWQSLRLRQTYDDLAGQPRYAAAIAFFQTDLYGGADFAQRDADVARVVPVMVRMLPERVIDSVAMAMELNRLSQELDREVVARLVGVDRGFTVADYCRAFSSMGRHDDRMRQVELIGKIGGALDGFVRKPLIHAAVTMMRKPARMAGLGALHDFLERGFEAFRAMGGAGYFLATITSRETQLIDRIFAGDPAPFADPWAPLHAASG